MLFLDLKKTPDIAKLSVKQKSIAILEIQHV